MATDGIAPTYSAAALGPREPSPLFFAPQTLYNPGQQLSDPSWSPSAPMFDPFVEEDKLPKERKATAHGSSNPDVSPSANLSNGHINATYDMPHITIDGELAAATAESQFDEMMASFIRGEDKNFALDAMRTDTPIRTPSLGTEFSTSSSSRPFSIPAEQPRAVSVTTRDPPPPGSRESSAASIALGQSETLESAEQDFVIVRQIPSKIIRSKKEGLGLARKSKRPTLGNRGKHEDEIWSQETLSTVGEAKRKWAGNYPMSTLLKDISNYSPPAHNASRASIKGDSNELHVTKMLKMSADVPQGELKEIH